MGEAREAGEADTARAGGEPLMPVSETGDPRLQALFGASDPRADGIRPSVRLPRKGLPPTAIGAGAAILAVLLFTVLNERRTAPPEASVRPGADTSVAFQPPPPLYVPQAPPQPAVIPVVPVQQTAARPLVAPAPLAPPAPRSTPIVYAPPIAPAAPPPIPMQQPRQTSTGAPLVIDTGSAAGPTRPAPGSFSALAGNAAGGRLRASTLANRAATVAQGTLIPAVLETAFNSTQPGFARAIVSRDVRSFDGSKVLIPRGSRLIGEYRSDVGQGQKRAIIIWNRLIRPDGMTIELDSPAVDTMGRGGVPASVNTHFLQRLGDALLQTTVGLGSTLAQRSVTGPVVVLPGAGTQVAGLASPRAYVPTLTVPAGKSISIFVAHDLDFSTAGDGR